MGYCRAFYGCRSRSGRGSAGVVHGAGPVTNTRGTYQFTTTQGQVYSGMSTRNIGARINSHAANGVYPAGSPITVLRMPYSTKLDIRIQEQKLINGQGGVGDPNIANKINSIAPQYWIDLGI